VIFLTSFTVLLIVQMAIVVCPLGDEEANSSYPYAHGLNGLMGLPIYVYTYCMELSGYLRYADICPATCSLSPTRQLLPGTARHLLMAAVQIPAY
jgi:hypothetical protein